MPYPEMPDAGYLRKQLTTDHENRENPHRWKTQEIRQLLEGKYGEEVIGFGSECIVVPIKGKEQRVAAYSYNGLEPNQAKRLFYLHRIFSTLFPKNFPHFYAAFGKTRDSTVPVTGTIRYKIEGVRRDTTILPSVEREAFQKPSRQPIKPKFPFKRVEEETEKMGVSFFFDRAHTNFIVGNDGGEYYVDVLEDSLPANYPREKILSYMEQHGYSPEEKRVVEISLARLEAIPLFDD